MSEYTRELSKDILERLQTQRVVGNQTGASQADVSITEALTLLAEIERLHDELRDAHQRYHDRFSHIAEGWRKRRLERIRAEKEKAWDEGYCDKDSEASEAMIERGLRERATNPYRKEEN